MHYTVGWADDAETELSVEVRGGLGLFDYMPPLNNAAGLALLADGPVRLCLDLGWSVPFPARGFASLRHHVNGAPANIHTIVVIAKNPLARWAMWWLFLRPYPDMRAKVVLRTQV